MRRERIVYDFCPLCGALSKNGICTSCGSDSNLASVRQDQPGQQMQTEPTPQPESDRNDMLMEVPKKKHTALIVGLCVGAAVFAFLLCLAVWMIVIRTGIVYR